MNKFPLLSTALFVFLLTSLTANFLLYRKLKNNYIELYQTSLNPLGIDRYTSRDNISDISSATIPKVVFFGDSRAYGWKAPTNSNWQFINRGISGQTSAQILWRFDNHVAPLKPEIIILQLGVNDLRMLPSAKQTRGDLVANCQQNITQIVQKAKEIDAIVILTTIFPLGSGNVPLRYKPFWASIEEMERDIAEINRYLRTLGDRVILLDAHTLLKEQDRNKIKYYKDLLHINKRGYELLNQELEKILMEIQLKANI